MSDNTSRFPTTDGDALRSDDTGAAKIQVAKIATGLSGIDRGVLTRTNPLAIRAFSNEKLWGATGERLVEMQRLLRARHARRGTGGGIPLVPIPSGTSAPFTPAQVAALIAWWNADYVTLVNSGNNVGSITPCAGSSAGDATFILANADGTFATVPLYETPDINGKATWGTAADEIRYLQTLNFSTALNQPMTWFQVWYTFSATNAVYFRLNTSGSSSRAPSMIANIAGDLLQSDTSPATDIAYAVGTVNITAHRYDPGTGLSVAYLNSLTPTATGTTAGDTFTNLFSGTFPDGEPGSYRQRHILACDATLTTPDFNSIMTYLAADAGVTLI